LLARLDAAIFGSTAPRGRREALEAFVPYLEGEIARGTPLKSMTRHLMGLFAGLPGGRRWRRLPGALSNERAAADAAIASLVSFAEGIAGAETDERAAA
jgi:tRNA-dihydrouridine synthase A